jgi:hypothetical protein
MGQFNMAVGKSGTMDRELEKGVSECASLNGTSSQSVDLFGGFERTTKWRHAGSAVCYKVYSHGIICLRERS